jgi:GH35 family endo-1,4-beta-xylanase
MNSAARTHSKRRHARLDRVRAARTLAGLVFLSAAACRRDGTTARGTGGAGAAAGTAGGGGGGTAGTDGGAGSAAGQMGMDAGAAGNAGADGGAGVDAGSHVDVVSAIDAPSSVDAASVADAAVDAGSPVDSGDAPLDAGPLSMTLRTVAAPTGRLIGAALGASHLAETAYAATAAREFDFVTPENEMKWDATEPTENSFDFSAGDAIVAFAQDNGMKVKGHNLVWHSQLPDWVPSITSAADLHDAMINHITQVVSHFRGEVIAWDVVNEAVADGGQGLRASIFYRLLGAGYIDDAFRAARAADPAALLIYNDYGAEGSGAKSDYVYNMVKGMLARGVPINAVGLQMHTGTADSPSASAVAANMQRLALLGLNVFVSEMDVQICTGDLNAQSARFHDIVADCAQAPLCLGVTVWGVSDQYSWLNGMTCATPQPLLFDDNYVSKPAYTGVMNAFLGL